VYEAAQTGWMGALGRFGVMFFGTYLFCERLLLSTKLKLTFQPM
jgi:hypothetical protein